MKEAVLKEKAIYSCTLPCCIHTVYIHDNFFVEEWKNGDAFRAVLNRPLREAFKITLSIPQATP